jgi:hypothetical protein
MHSPLTTDCTYLANSYQNQPSSFPTGIVMPSRSRTQFVSLNSRAAATSYSSSRLSHITVTVTPNSIPDGLCYGRVN